MIDRIAWKEASGGAFSVKSAYALVSQSHVKPEIKLFKLIHTMAKQALDCDKGLHIFEFAQDCIYVALRADIAHNKSTRDS